jgi:two-component sensor histidine kinase
VDGAAIVLGRQYAQNFSLVLHELAPNAIKHGALSNWTAAFTFGGTSGAMAAAAS